MIQINFKIDEADDPRLAAWVKSFKGKRSRELSANIRRVLRIYLNGQLDQEGER